MNKNIIRYSLLNNDIIRYPLPSSTQMYGWILPNNVTNGLLEFFHNNIDKSKPGVVGSLVGGHEINTDSKQSLDLIISPNDSLKDSSNDFNDDLRIYRKYLQLCLDDYLKIYSHANNVKGFGILDYYNIQYYEKGGGFKTWHKENDLSLSTAHRHLVFMTYLNDVPNGGTEFLYQNLTTPAKKGLTLIWPAGWTHTHKGQISKDYEKYIVTGWYGGIEIYDKIRNK